MKNNKRYITALLGIVVASPVLIHPSKSEASFFTRFFTSCFSSRHSSPGKTPTVSLQKLKGENGVVTSTPSSTRSVNFNDDVIVMHYNKKSKISTTPPINPNSGNLKSSLKYLETRF